MDWTDWGAGLWGSRLVLPFPNEKAHPTRVESIFWGFSFQCLYVSDMCNCNLIFVCISFWLVNLAASTGADYIEWHSSLPSYAIVHSFGLLTTNKQLWSGRGYILKGTGFQFHLLFIYPAGGSKTLGYFIIIKLYSLMKSEKNPIFLGLLSKYSYLFVLLEFK